MKSTLGSWSQACERSGPLRFVDVNLRGVGQVMFQDNPLSGLLFLAAIAWGSVAAGAIEVLVGGVVALLSATLMAIWLRADARSLQSGLFGYNGVLVGLALPTFLAPSPLLWFYLVLGGAVSVVCMLGTVNVTKAWSVSALTFPFVLTTWLLLLATYGFSGLQGQALPFANQIQPIDASATSLLEPAGFLAGMLHSVSQVFLKGNGVSALLFLVGLAVSSLPAAAFGLVTIPRQSRGHSGCEPLEAAGGGR